MTGRIFSLRKKFLRPRWLDEINSQTICSLGAPYAHFELRQDLVEQPLSNAEGVMGI